MMGQLRGDDGSLAAGLLSDTEPCLPVSETILSQRIIKGFAQTNTCKVQESCYTWGDFVTALVISRQENTIMCSLSNTTLKCNNVPGDQSYWVSFEEKSFARGQHFKVYSGRLNGRGRRSGDWCVVKVFTRAAGTQKMCANEVDKCKKAKVLTKEFNAWLPTTEDTRIKFSYIFWAPMDEVSWVKQVFFSGKRRLSVKDMVLIEDDLRYDEERPRKKKEMTMFMDNLGRKSTCIAKDLEAFAHFTYHHSGEQLVVCDLEGVQDSEGFYLKTPVIHSREKKFGKSDMGLQGIITVFSNHVCNQLCKDLIKPCEILDNFRVCNSDNTHDTHSTSTVSCSNNHTCPAYREAVFCTDHRTCPAYREFQDSSNNNNFPQSYSLSPSCADSMSNLGSRCFSCSGPPTCGHFLEPSAPPEEDIIYESSPWCRPQARDNFVAQWIVHEQISNNFIASRSFPPSQNLAVCDSLDNGADVSQILSSKTDINNGNFLLPDPCNKCLTDSQGASDKTTRDLCNNEHASASLSTGFWSSPGSSTRLPGKDTKTSKVTSKSCNSCQTPDPLSQNPAKSASYSDPQVLDSGCSSYTNRPSVEFRRASCPQVCSNCARHLIDSPPPYVQTPYITQ